MKCKIFQENYLIVLYEEMNEKEALQYREHMNKCNECKSLFYESTMIKNLFNDGEYLAPSDYALEKVKKYSLNKINSPKTGIWNILFSRALKLGFLSFLIMALVVMPFIYKKLYIKDYTGENTSLYNEKEMDKNIKKLTYITSNFSDRDSFSGYEKNSNLWEISPMDEKITDLEIKVKSLKNDFNKF